ncbi:ABC transporter permease [Candidatus Cryosericum hinesii]|jgi:peptide/nickel transport system permease protein|uniref:ABC transporter permease n=1 Tax=Candidatus Cryosericum hinesii TaxID=2290915 RepID=A0A398DX89_9BACT|nr:ABC transporter permease [Candidatus Cryosericum hinesii]RIE11174.1 ABC transporter permease [Candidatus Cryosericum hinesii]RIE15071.1 ABC transporter permease [Candidatus Cryosericum hinesii]RIE15595.1 ABC transporter permease [Candidatus Cryosericum hinesii]
MRNYIIRRLLLLILVLWGVTLVTFILMHVVPGDPAKVLLGKLSGNEVLVTKLRHQLGLDKPLVVQYFEFVKGILRGNLGNSYKFKASVMSLILERMPATIKLTFGALIIGLLIGLSSGIISAVRRYSVWDTLSMLFAFIGVSMPVFWLAMLLQLLFAVKLGWFHVSGFEGLRDLVLPSVTLGLIYSASIARMTRSSILEVIRMDYVRTARAKGAPERIVFSRHVFRNALIPIVTMIGMQFGGLLTGAALTETVFQIPGVGKLLINSTLDLDYPMIQGGVMFVAIVFVLVNLFVDVLYAYLDPTIRYD